VFHFCKTARLVCSPDNLKNPFTRPNCRRSEDVGLKIAFYNGRRRIEVKVAIPRFEEEVAPCFEYSANIAIFTIRGRKVVAQKGFPLQSRDAFDRFRLLRDQQVKTLICGGVQDFFEDLLRANGIHVISWVTGSVDELLDLFIRGRLSPGGRSTHAGPASPAPDK
jgi:predicted Fe-Mo cluster-binding NifX family protein